MQKIFTLAVAVSFLPVAQQNTTTGFVVQNSFAKPAYIFSNKNTANTNIFEPEKKTTESWSQSWMTKAQENIRKSEYHFKWEEKLKAYCTPNRKNNLRFFYNEKGFSVEPRTTKIPIGDFDPMAMPEDIKYRNIPHWKINLNLDKKQAGKGFWQVQENIAAYITEKVTIQYINNDEGMRQNFIVYTPLSTSNQLNIDLLVKSKLQTVVKNNQVQFIHNKNAVLLYEDLLVWDATGRRLHASFIKTNKNNFSIQVDSEDAVYPITIDPLSTTPDALLESNQAGARMGFSVSSAGDVNGDGYSDVVVGVHGYDNTEIDEGAAYVYHGSSAGINTTPVSILESNQNSARMGLSVSTAGDVNGDGYSDIIVGIPFYDNVETDEGAFQVFHGSAAGIITTPAAFVESNQAGAQMGYSVACAGDVNGDGFSDVVVGAWLYDNPEINEGAAFVYHGSASGISLTATTTVESNQAGANFGISVAGAGDVNGDGYSDIIVGAEDYDNGEMDEGVAFIYHGSPTGISSVAAVFIESDRTLCQFGFSVSSAGDVNGDGYSDVIVGAYLYNDGQPNEGVAFVYHGSGSGITGTAVTLLKSNQAAASFGVSVACAGDINGDGFSDVIVGANQYDDGQTNEGAAFVYQGSLTGINSASVIILQMNQASADMGRAVGAAGDVNGDGYSDVIVGAQQYDNPDNNEGGAFVFHGSAAGLSTSPNSTPDDANQAGAYYGYSVASAGDVNGDGYSDVIIGAYLYDDGANSNEGNAFVYHGSAAGLSATPNSTADDADQASAYFGVSVACAGDVNGDGYSDVIIGAPYYDVGANLNEGRTYVYHGSAAGLLATPNSIADDADQASAFFGWSVSGAGDVNGDGYSDVIIGAYQYNDGPNTDEGRAFVYHGSATGLSATPNSTPDDADQANSRFGNSVASAGDVNGDGYSDVIIGAYYYLDGANAFEGRAFVYHGSATGLSATPNSTPNDANQPSVGFGFSVASAGDVNGDGYSDVIIGAYRYDDGANTDEGRAFVYHGSAAGISATPDSTPDDADQANARFGNSVACAGDVNGDGYSDVIIGAPNYTNGANVDEGRVFVYYGSATGLSATPNSTAADANQASANFGFSVAGAGDVNGDGYSDVIIGAYRYDDGGNTDEGVAFVYNGNDSTSNRRNNLRLYNTDLATPFNSSNFIFSNFGTGLYAKSFLGRAKGKLVWETRLSYDPYSGTPITNSALFTAQQSTYIDLELTGVELKNIIDKIAGASRFTKLRARVKYDPVTALTGQMFSPWRNVSSIIDANNLGALPIELISFKAAWLQKGKTARLDFITDKETGICCFDIEKSTDGFNFYRIGSVEAKNTAARQSYTFIDADATNKNQYYRLKIKGINGKTELSNIQQLQNDKATEILVFPNPTTDVLQLQLNGSFDKMKVLIVNSSGQVVKQLNLSVSNQIIAIHVQNLAAGKYWLHLQSGDEKQVLQFVKQ